MDPFRRGKYGGAYILPLLLILYVYLAHQVAHIADQYLPHIKDYILNHPILLLSGIDMKKYDIYQKTRDSAPGFMS